MNSKLIAPWRMNNLRLEGTPFEAAEEVVLRLGAVQSQDYGPAKWSLAQRTSGVSDAAIERAFADGTILRTHVLRPTWHFVSGEDIRWIVALTAPRVHALNGYMYRQLELDDAVLKKSTAVLVDSLKGGNHPTRKELGSILASSGIEAQGFRLAYIVMNAELNGILCSGPRKGKQQTYALIDERASQARSLDHDEALAELTLRYFTSHGPATAKDFRGWSSLTATDVKQGLEMAAPKLENETIDGLTYWFAGAPPRSEAVSPTVHLLQPYDEYIMGYSESKYLLDTSGAARSISRDKVVFNGIVILDTQVAGHWKRTLSKGSVIVEVALYKAFDDAQARALQTAADRHGEFLGLPATVVTKVV